MEKSDIKTIARLLSRVESSQGEQFREAVKDGRLEYSEILYDGDGALVVYRTEGAYKAVCAFKDVVRDYATARKVEDTVTAYLKTLKDDEEFTLFHGGEQLYLNNFVCKLNFEKPHYGLEYRLKRKDFQGAEACDMRGLEARLYAYDQPDAMFALHQRAFAEQTVRAGHPEGYDEEDIAYLTEQFGKPDDEKTLYTYYLDGALVGYTLFEGGYCDLIALDPAYQHMGLGKPMLTYAVGKAFEDPKVKHVFLHTFLINLKAQRLYESLGFKRVGFYCDNNAKPKNEMFFST